MAKMQRWRRRGSAGEGSSTVTDTSAEEPVALDDVTTTDDEPTPGTPDDARTTAEQPETDATPTVTTSVTTAGDVLARDDLAQRAQESEGAPEEQPDEQLDEELDEVDDDLDLDPDLETDLDDPEDPEDLDEDELDELDATGERPPLPHVPDRSGPLGFLLGGRRPADVVALQLLQAAHAKQAISTALALGLVAAVAGRPAREAGVVLLTVLVGQTILGWHNDIVDRDRDRAHGLTGKPLAMGRLTAETTWYAIVVATLLLIPLAITTGIRAGCLYLAAVAIAMLGNVLLRTGIFSWWSWAASYALFPAYLSYGGWGGQAVGSPPETVIVVLAALLGVGVHFMRSVWGLVADHEDGWTYLPLRLGLKIGATRLLALSTFYCAVIVVLLVVMGARVGLSR